MAGNALLFLVVTLITSIFWLVAFAFAFWRWGSPSTRRRKPPTSDEPTLTSGHLARLEADQAELFAALEKTQTTVKRLSSRQGMRDKRESDQDAEVPPIGTDKATLLRHYGMSGKVGPDFARAQLKRETN